jgi:hypothetical protein
MKKAYHVVLIACLCIIAFAILMALYMLADGVYFGVPMTLSSQGTTIATVRDLYHPGDQVDATINYCKSRNIDGVIDWQLIDTYVRFYPATNANLPTGCHTYVMELGKVPGDVTGDTYHFTGLLTYKINSLTTVSYPLQTNSFMVENP